MPFRRLRTPSEPRYLESLISADFAMCQTAGKPAAKPADKPAEETPTEPADEPPGDKSEEPPTTSEDAARSPECD